MLPSSSELQVYYSRLQDNELLQIYIESGLTENAESAIVLEIKERGLTEQDISNLRQYNNSILEEQNKKVMTSLKKDIKRTAYFWLVFIIFAIIAYIIGL